MIKRGKIVSSGSMLRNIPSGTLASIIFYIITGIILLILLPLSNYPPHLGLTGVLSIITGYALLTKRAWARWLVAALFFVITTMTLYTIAVILFSNITVTIGMLVYAILTWYFTYYVFIKKI